MLRQVSHSFNHWAIFTMPLNVARVSCWFLLFVCCLLGRASELLQQASIPNTWRFPSRKWWCGKVGKELKRQKLVDSGGDLESSYFFWLWVSISCYCVSSHLLHIVHFRASNEELWETLFVHPNKNRGSCLICNCNMLPKVGSKVPMFVPMCHHVFMGCFIPSLFMWFFTTRWQLVIWFGGLNFGTNGLGRGVFTMSKQNFLWGLHAHAGDEQEAGLPETCFLGFWVIFEEKDR